MARRIGQGADPSEGYGLGSCRGNGVAGVAGQGEFLDQVPG